MRFLSLLGSILLFGKMGHYWQWHSFFVENCSHEKLYSAGMMALCVWAGFSVLSTLHNLANFERYYLTSVGHMKELASLAGISRKTARLSLIFEAGVALIILLAVWLIAKLGGVFWGSVGTFWCMLFALYIFGGKGSEITSFDDDDDD